MQRKWSALNVNLKTARALFSFLPHRTFGISPDDVLIHKIKKQKKEIDKVQMNERKERKNESQGKVIYHSQVRGLPRSPIQVFIHPSLSNGLDTPSFPPFFINWITVLGNYHNKVSQIGYLPVIYIFYLL